MKMKSGSITPSPRVHTMELRKINKEDAKAQWEYTTALPTDENGLTNPYNGVSYDEYITNVLPKLISYEHPVNMPDWFVPETYFYLWDEGRLVGEFRIRHHLTETLRNGAGHIGYSIKRDERGKGYGTAGLKLTIAEAKKIVPENEIYLRVNKDNIASQKVMLNNGAYRAGEDEDHYFLRIRKNERVYDTVLFDLDGTLTDSGKGIMHSFEYAIQQMGDTAPDREKLRRFVGPPLEDSFRITLGYSEEDTRKVIAHYREYYFNRGGALENEVYAGIEELLKKLKQSGKKLAVATSKNERGTKLVLEHFGLVEYFDVVAASNDTDRRTKADVIRYALDQLGVTDKSSVLMVGDRNHDINAANEIGIDSVGVLWGYGDLEELQQAGATYVIDRPEEVLWTAVGRCS